MYRPLAEPPGLCYSEPTKSYRFISVVCSDRVQEGDLISILPRDSKDCLLF